jgi:hypothetical protein
MHQPKHLDTLAETLGWFRLNFWMVQVKLLGDSAENLG